MKPDSPAEVRLSKLSWLMPLVRIVAISGAIMGVLFLCGVFTFHDHGAKKTACLSNLHQMGVGLILYAEDNDDHFPRSGAWMDESEPYSRSESILHDSEGIKQGEYGYAFRHNASARKDSEIRSPSTFILLFDSSLTERNASSELWSIPQDGRHKSESGTAYDNVTFADGHARTNRTTVSGLGRTLQEALAADDASISATTKGTQRTKSAL